MSRSEAVRWAATVGRVGLVAFLALAAAANGAWVTDGPYVVPVIASAVACAAALLVPRLRRSVAPVLITVVTAWWGWLTVPLLGIVVFDLVVARRTRWAVGCAAVALGANVFGYPATTVWAEQRYASVAFVLLLGLVLGLWLGNRRRLLRALASDVEHLRVEARLREEAARIGERSRIAAEMHDVLAHRLSLIALHTGVLTTKGDTVPPPVAERLGLLRKTSVEALADLRDVLGVLRDFDAAPTDAALTPVMRDVGELADEARAAGQRIELTTDGRPEQAPTTHRLAVYRIVREALTNARKHAHGAEVTVRVDYRPPATRVEVTNPAGTSRTDTVGSGYGLVGLRERVTALGGQLTAGPAGAGAWRVAARIPHPTGIEQDGTSP
ncbi:sensor histidine kinase [Streptomyces sp. NPDC002324]